MAAPHDDKSKPYIPLAGGADDGWSNEEEATATCFCGAVQLKFPTQGPGLVGTFVCHCSDCRKLTASMFASNFTIADTHLTHLRGRENLTSYGQSRTVSRKGNTMTNCFCKTCGTLMYRVGSAFPGQSILRIGTVDDFHLHETKLRPQMEQFVENRVDWLHPADGIKQVEGQFPF
ncbi:Mss4-like protein [Mycena leptocephala]|nr:Mss4-like protein [Mycena leptocephala]